MVTALIFLGIFAWLLLLGWCWENDQPVAKFFKGFSLALVILFGLFYFLPYALEQEDGPAFLMYAAIIGGAALLGWIASDGGKKL